MSGLTIVIPSFGRDSVERAIKSVANQTIYTDMIVMIDNIELGAGPTRNVAIKLVKTDWVGFCDDDDYLSDHYHKWLILESEDADVVVFQMQIGGGIVIPGHLNPDQLRRNWVGISFALRTEWAKRFPFRNMIGEDYDLLERLKKAGARIKVSEHTAYYVRGN